MLLPVRPWIYLLAIDLDCIVLLPVCLLLLSSSQPSTATALESHLEVSRCHTVPITPRADYDGFKDVRHTSLMSGTAEAMRA